MLACEAALRAPARDGVERCKMPNAPLAGGALGAAHRGTTDRLASDGHEESKGNMAFLKETLSRLEPWAKIEGNKVLWSCVAFKIPGFIAKTYLTGLLQVYSCTTGLFSY